MTARHVATFFLISLMVCAAFLIESCTRRKPTKPQIPAIVLVHELRGPGFFDFYRRNPDLPAKF